MALERVDFHNIVEQHGPALYRLAYRLTGDPHDAEEVLQETLRSAWTSRDRFDRSRGVRAWLASILRRRVVDRWRVVGRNPRLATGDQGCDPLVEADDPHAADYTDEMQRALDQLPHDMRDALLLVIVGELTHQEAAVALGVPLGTVLSRVSRGRERLRDRLIAQRQRRRVERATP